MKIRSETVSTIVKGVPPTPTFINCKKGGFVTLVYIRASTNVRFRTILRYEGQFL